MIAGIVASEGGRTPPQRTRWDPSYLQSDCIWFDTDSPITYDPGSQSNIKRWHSHGATGHDIVPGSTPGPKFLSGQDGVKHLSLDSNNGGVMMYSPVEGPLSYFSSVSAGWIFAIYKREKEDTANRERPIFGFANNASGFRIGLFASGGSVKNRLTVSGRRLDSDSVAGANDPMEEYGDWVMGLGELNYRDARARLFKNGALVSQNNSFQTPGVTSSTASSKANLGANVTINASNYLDGMVAMVLVGNFLLMDDEIEKIYGWASWKLGIQRLLPASHPYKNEPPYI